MFSGDDMNLELQARIAPITSRLWMLAAKPVHAAAQTSDRPGDRPAATSSRKRPGQLIRTTA
jgi:hypothetical protein